LLSEKRFDTDTNFRLEGIIKSLNEKLAQCKNQLVNEINQREAVEINCDEKIRVMEKKVEEANIKVQ
jgi:hypothetical protein